MRRPIVHFSRKYRFAASHRLQVDAKSPEWNREVFGKCNNPYGHGHNYVAQVTFSGPVDEKTGMVTNLADLDGFAKVRVMDLFDHANLNALDCFRDQVPSTENLCRELWVIFMEYPHANLERIRVEETGNNSFDYFGEGAEVEHDS